MHYGKRLYTVLTDTQLPLGTVRVHCFLQISGCPSLGETSLTNSELPFGTSWFSASVLAAALIMCTGSAQVALFPLSVFLVISTTEIAVCSFLQTKPSLSSKKCRDFSKIS